MMTLIQSTGMDIEGFNSDKADASESQFHLVAVQIWKQP